jgi:hypothetical protein
MHRKSFPSHPPQHFSLNLTNNNLLHQPRHTANNPIGFLFDVKTAVNGDAKLWGLIAQLSIAGNPRC